jgi:hypothetical protein
LYIYLKQERNQMQWRKSKNFISLFVFMFLSFGQVVLTIAQNAESRRADVPPPSSESFSPATDLLSPWRSSRCARLGREMFGHSCVNYVGDEYVNNAIVTLYNEDGTVWRKIDLSAGSSQFPKDFLPFAVNWTATVTILRMVGESRSWYKVEINEDTRATKYARRDDKSWSRTSWEGWLYYSVNFELDENQAPLRDAPNGRVIPTSDSVKFDVVRFLKADGDWAYVEGNANPRMPNPEFHRGWLRWRNGRQILVGCYFNDFKVPSSVTEP